MRCEDCDEYFDTTHDAVLHLIRITHRIEREMTSFSSDQAHLDSDVQAETADLSLIEAEIAALKNQPTSAALDFSGLDAAVARVKGDTPAPTPAPAPAAAPVDPTTAATAPTPAVAASDPNAPAAAPTTPAA